MLPSLEVKVKFTLISSAVTKPEEQWKVVLPPGVTFELSNSSRNSELDEM